MVVFVMGMGEGRFEARETLETLIANAQVVRAE